MIEGSADDQTMKVEPESEKSLGMMAILAQQSETLGISLAAMNAPPPPEVVTHQQNHPSVTNDPADNTPKSEPVTSSAADAMAILAEQSTAMGTAPADDQSIILPGVISASGGGVAAQDHAIMSTAPAAANAPPPTEGAMSILARISFETLLPPHVKKGGDLADVSAPAVPPTIAAQPVPAARSSSSRSQSKISRPPFQVGKRCGVELCPKLAAAADGYCVDHKGTDKNKPCNEESCSQFATRWGLCVKHGGRHICIKDGCINKAQKGGLCIAHRGNSRKICKWKGCVTFAAMWGLCVKHGGYATCSSTEGCTKKVVRKGGLCVIHGGTARKKPCVVEGCMTDAKKGGLCCKHGGRYTCGGDDGECNKVVAQKGGSCVQHGGIAINKPCKIEGCPTGAQKMGLCVKHGGFYTCSMKGCSKNAKVGGRCKAHQKPQKFDPFRPVRAKHYKADPKPKDPPPPPLPTTARVEKMREEKLREELERAREPAVATPSTH